MHSWEGGNWTNSFFKDNHKYFPFNLFAFAECQGDKRSPPPTCPASCFPCNLTDNMFISFASSSAKQNASIYVRALEESSNMWCVEMQARNIKNHVSFLSPCEVTHEKAALLSVDWGKLVNISLMIRGTDHLFRLPPGLWVFPHLKLNK